jgi:hypothetical protein
MAKRTPAPAPPTPPDEVVAPLPEDDFVASLKSELAKTQRASTKETGEDLTHRGELNRRFLQDLWEVHNQFENAAIHLTVEPSQTLFATFVEYPGQWMFKESFDFGAIKTIELRDRTQGWVGFTLRFWYYSTPEGKAHLRGVYEWCEGESYHRYTGWMRMMSQAVLFDHPEEKADLREIHRILKDIVVAWYTAHLEHAPEKLTDHLKEKYPKGASYARESYRA